MTSVCAANLSNIFFDSVLTNFHLQEIASEVQSESKWKQLGELAMSTGKVSLLFSFVYLVLFHSHVLRFVYQFQFVHTFFVNLVSMLDHFNFIFYIDY